MNLIDFIAMTSMTLTLKQQTIIEIAHEWASNVVGMASNLIAKLSDNPENKVIKELNDDELRIFMKTYLDHLISAYAMQINAITDKIKNIESNQ